MAFLLEAPSMWSMPFDYCSPYNMPESDTEKQDFKVALEEKMQKKARELARTCRRQGKWREHADGTGNDANMQKIKELARDQGCFRRTAVNCDGLQRNGDRSEWQRSGRINL